MILIVVVDDKNGMTFNHRRQSRDSVLREHILALTKNSRLWMNHYTYQQFSGSDAAQMKVDESFLEKADAGDYCFVENVPVDSCEKYVEKIIKFKWNREYPADFYFGIDVTLPVWKMIETEEFAGSSHEKITKEFYIRG